MKKIVVAGVVTLGCTLVLAATTWNFAATLDSISSKEHASVHERIDKKLDKIYEKIIELHTGGK